MGKYRTAIIDGKTFLLVPQSQAEKTEHYECDGDGTKPCYKAGHQFSRVGAYGNANGKGHQDLNPTHVMRKV